MNSLYDLFVNLRMALTIHAKVIKIKCSSEILGNKIP